MTSRGQPVSRRGFLVGTGVCCLGLPLHARGQTASDGFRLLHARRSRAGQAAPSPLLRLSYDDAIPGPTLRVKQGDELRVRLVNELAEPTSLHWHGLRLPNAMDGVPRLTQSAVTPGASFDYRFRPPDAGTFWYHAPGAQADQGLHGPLVIEETHPVDVDRDIVLLFAMPSDGSTSPAPVFVNGALRSDISVQSGQRLRLRLINATAARGFTLKFAAPAPWIMAIDGQPAEPFLARDSRVGLGPGARVDLFTDMTGDAGTIAPIVTGRDEHVVARLVYARGDGSSRARGAEPSPLPPNPLPARIDLKNALKVELELANGKPLDPAGPPLFAVKRGRPVSLGIRNSSGRPQVVHLHGHHFRLLDRLDDGWKPYWMDTLVVGGPTERIAFVADNPGKWLIDSRMLEHQDAETAVWFAVT